MVSKKLLSAYTSSNISETQQDRTKATNEDQWPNQYALSIGAKINDLKWQWRVIMQSVSKHFFPYPTPIPDKIVPFGVDQWCRDVQRKESSG